MRGRILLGAGLVVGYVLGARAGRGAYDQLRLRVDRVAHSPQVGHALDTAKHAAEQAAPKLTGTIEGVAGAVADAGESASPPTPAKKPASTLQEGTRATAPAGDDATSTATD